MTRPKLILGVLAAACVGTLLWYAWLILAADLPRGATIAMWALWLVSTASVVTLWAYVREFLTHREAAGRDASWKPLPSLLLLWIGGLTAMVSFAFILPGKTPAAGADEPAATTTSLTGQQVDGTGAAADGTRSATTTSRSTASRTTPPAPVSTTAPRATSATSTSSSSSTSTDASTSSTTTKSKPTKPHPGTGSPTRSTTSSGGPLVSITLPPPPG